MTGPPHGTRRLPWNRRAAIAAWMAWLASYALVGYQFFAPVIHPHFLPLVSLLLLGFAATIVALGLGLWRMIRGPRRIAAMGWSLAAAIPILLWAAHASYAMSTARTLDRPLPGYRLRLAAVGAAGAFDGLARFARPNRLEGEHTVMIYDECDDPEADLAAMDRHIEHVGQVLGRPLPTKVYWVRGGLLGMTGLLKVGGVSLVGMAVCGDTRPRQGSLDRLTSVDRHEAAHNVLMDQLPAMACAPTVLNEGWAESQSGESMDDRAWTLAERGRQSALSLRQLLSPEKYIYGGYEVYFQGGVLVDFLLRRYGGERFYELMATCRPETIAGDCQRVYGANPDQLDDLFWADLVERAPKKPEKQAVAPRPKRQKSISAELGLPDGPNDESARQEFLQRYPKEVEKLKETYRHVRMAAVAKYEYAKSSGITRPPEDADSEAVRDGERVRVTKHRNYTLIVVAAPQLSFRLLKERGEPRLRTLWAGTAPRDGYNMAIADVRRATPELDAPYHVMGTDLLEWTRSPGFKVTRATRVQEGSRRLLRVYYEYDPAGEDDPWVEGAGWLSFRPDDCWVLEAYETRTRTPGPPEPPPRGKEGKSPEPVIGISQGTVRYRGKEKGVPVVESLEQTDTRDGKPMFTKTVRITEIHFGPAPDDTFDLASFDADPPAKRPERAAGPEEPKEDIFVRLARWLVWAIWSCTAGVVISAAVPLVRRGIARNRAESTSEGACLRFSVPLRPPRARPEGELD